MNQTPNYQLNQWEAADQVLRADFNADNAKIDAAIHAVADGLPRLITGEYMGTASLSVHIPLPGRPKLVLIRTEYTYSSSHYTRGVLFTDMCTCYFSSSGSVSLIGPSDKYQLEEDGFLVNSSEMNHEGYKQHYLAVI